MREPPSRTVFINPGETVWAKSGERLTIIVKRPPRRKVDVSIDGHSHIQSGATAPLPLIWNQMADIRLRRSILNALAPFAVKGGKIQRKKTEEIADILASELTTAYKNSKLLNDEPYRSNKAGQQNTSEPPDNAPEIFSPAIIMPMDMDYAHIAGFPPRSTTIYHEGRFKVWAVNGPDGPPVEVIVDGVYYYNRQKANAPESRGNLVDVSHERPNRAWVFQHYFLQHNSTVASVKKNPWQLIPMFHYEPRRWRNPANGDFDKKAWSQGPWDEPFKHIATGKNSGLFIGFKMYTPLGYKPIDPRLPFLDEFYAKCEAEGIPILAHCSPGGMTTHEADFYHALDNADLKSKPSRIVSCTYDPCTPLGYFYDNYVHPRNWRPVLMKYPKLKLCLAHFGGSEWEKLGLASDWVEEIVNLCNPKTVQGHNSQGREIRFENVYTDISCYNLRHAGVKKNVRHFLWEMRLNDRYRHFKDKLLFGVDWYLSIVTKAPKYEEYVESFFDAMGEADQWQWYRSTLINPATFYGLDNQEIVNNMYQALEDNGADKSKRKSGFDRITAIKEQVEALRGELTDFSSKAKE